MVSTHYNMVAFVHLSDNQLGLFPIIFTAVSQAALIATVDSNNKYFFSYSKYILQGCAHSGQQWSGTALTQIK